MDVTTSLQMFGLIILMPVVTGILTYHFFYADTVARRNRTSAQVMRELEMQAAVREHNAPWWAAR